MINVILADHQRIFRIGMASALAAEEDIRIVGQPQSTEQLLRGLVNFRPHVLVLSSAFLAEANAIQEVCSRQDTAILLLREPEDEVSRDLSMQVHGVMGRSADEATIVRSVRHLAKGGKLLWLVRNRATEAEEDPVGMRVRERLAPQELRIIALVIQGYRNREIAVRIGATEQSIKYSLRKIFDKTGVFGRLELALFVIQHRTLQQAAAAHSRPEWNPVTRLGPAWPMLDKRFLN